MDDDEFWNTSDVKAKAQNFEDDEASEQFSKLGAEIRAGLGQSASYDSKLSNATSPILLPIHNLISDETLKNILLFESGQNAPKENQKDVDLETSVSITLKRLVIGRPCRFYHFKSLKSKTELLDGAIAIGDGNAILSVVLFLVQTLKKKLVYQILSSRPVAVNHYVNYLTARLKNNEITDLLTMLGRSSEAAIKQYQTIMDYSGEASEALLNKLKNLSANHFSNSLVDPIQTKILNDYIKLLEWQKLMNVSEIQNKSVIKCLAYCCTNHWSDGVGKISSPQTFYQEQQISPLQYDWTVLSTQAVLKNWDLLETMFVKKNFLGRASLSCSVPLPKIIRRLHELGANTILLGVFLNYVSSVNERLEMAIKFKVNRTVVDCFVLLKDRQGLMQYKMSMRPQSEEYFHAENALRSTTVKWKN